MPNGLPYFKFIVADWINGKIAVEDLRAQGIFINVCAFYWTRSGNVNLSELEKKFPKIKRKYCRVLFENNLIKIKNEKVEITFLDDQLTKFNSISETNSANGKLGGRKPKATGSDSLNEIKATDKRSESEMKAIRGREEEEEEEEEEGEKKKRRLDEEIKEKLKESENEKKNTVANAPFEGELLTVWNLWEKHRKEKRSKLTPTTRDRQIKFLGAMTPSQAVEVINYSLHNGYTGLFSPHQIAGKNGKPINKKQEQTNANRNYLADKYGDKLTGKKF